ncbi:MAG: hypothetical protein U0003_04265 [Vampirovibrionales bacterium]
MTALPNTATHCRQVLHTLMGATPDLYTNLNALRDWVNAHFDTMDLYLEDAWNESVEGETHFEYRLRDKKTLEETPVLAIDVYFNHQDAGGVWHLGAYQGSQELLPMVETVVAFLVQQGAIASA